jgi:outer membrane protein
MHKKDVPMHIPTLTRLAFLAAAIALPTTDACGQDRIPADPDPTRLANAPRDAAPDSWQVRIGVGAVYSPTFLGSDEYQLRAGPSVEIRYKDRFFLSVIDGAGFDMVKTKRLRAGPIIKLQQQRRENGKNMFVIAGGQSDALRGLGDVPATAEAGGYIQYQSAGFSAKVEVRKGIGGHDGLIAEIGARYTTGLMGIAVGDRSVILSLGPRVTIVDDTYNKAYFGIDAGQSARSGLAPFDAGGGLQSYGVGAAVVIPIAGALSAAVLGGFDRLSGDAAKSPLVRDRGSRNQGTLGLGLTYRFGL